MKVEDEAGGRFWKGRMLEVDDGRGEFWRWGFWRGRMLEVDVGGGG